MSLILQQNTSYKHFVDFASPRSLSKILLSDNGSTFLAAAAELTHLLSSDELSERLAHKGAEWKFIPKRALWFGRFWEQLVSLSKSALKRTLGRNYATFESLQTIIVDVETLLNDQPLKHVSPDLRDPETITPTHFLCSKRITTLSDCTIELDEDDDPDFGDVSDLQRRPSAQALIVLNTFRPNRNKSILLP